MLVSFIKDADGVRKYPYKNVLKNIMDWIKKNIRFEIIFPLEHWNRHIEYIRVYSSQDCSALLLKFGNILELACWSEIEPFDNDEVKVHCHRCNGYVFSVSGYEWKTQRNLHTYQCQLTSDRKCAYD